MLNLFLYLQKLKCLAITYVERINLTFTSIAATLENIHELAHGL